MGLVLVLPTWWRVKLCLELLLGLAAVLGVLARWSEGHPARRRGFFIGVLFTPVLILGAEVVLAYLDWRIALLARPLRMTTEVDTHGLLARNEACSFQLRPSQAYDLWGGTVRIDANGFRSAEEVTLRKAPGRIRIMLTGGSTAFGWGVPDGQDLAGHLRVLLNGGQPGGGYEVINAAVPYYTSFHELNLYLHVLHAYAPDVLIDLHGRNDAYFAFKEGAQWQPVWAGKTGPAPFISSLGPLPSSEAEPFFDMQRLLMKSALYRRYDGFFPPLDLSGDLAFNPGKPGVPRRFTPPPSEVNPAFVDQFVRHRDLLARACAGDGCRCVLALQPVIYLGKPLTPEEEKYCGLWDDCGPHFRENWPRLQAAAARMDAAGATLVDLTDVFAAFFGEAYLDECHLTNAGNRLIAQQLAEIIRAQPPPRRHSATRASP